MYKNSCEGFCKGVSEHNSTFAPELHDECGIFGIWNHDDSDDVAREVYTALYALQHRGQESAGIAVNSGGPISPHKVVGLVNEDFNEMVLNFLKGSFACGHVLYGKSGMSTRDNAQPFVCKHTKGQIAFAHNGSIVNIAALRDELINNGAMFQTSSDAEVIAYIVARERLRTQSTERAMINAMEKIVGAYSLIIVTTNKLIAGRDPNGFRPLCMGKVGNSTVFASESCAIDAIGGEFIRDVMPGEVIVVNRDGITSHTDKCGNKGNLCVFEHIYFARPDSVIDGASVHFARRAAGGYLAEEHPVEADIVVGSPDSGLEAALGYAEKSGIPYDIGIIKNRYIGRTFIQTMQSTRENSVKLKLNPVSSVLRNKRVVVVDDSMVRGTTTGKLIELIRAAGATEVHLRIASPPFLHPCYFGTDIKSRNHLIACRLTVEEIRREIGADSLEFLSINAVSKIAKSSRIGFCDACFTGRFPVQVPETDADGNKNY